MAGARAVEEVLARTRVTIGLAGQEPTLLPLGPVLAGAAIRRVGLGVTEAPGPSFTIRVQSPEIGAFTVAAAALPGRVTVITLTLRPDGSSDLSQNLLPVPGADLDAAVPAIGYGRMLRDLQLGQRLYAGGELVERAPGSALLTDLLEARWTDPVVGCMSYFAVRDSGRSGPGTQESIARNLYRSFGDIADARVIHALAFPETRDQSLPGLLEADQLPLLTRSAAELTRLAREHGPARRPRAELNRQVVPGQPWFMSWQPDWDEVAFPLMVTN